MSLTTVGTGTWLIEAPEHAGRTPLIIFPHAGAGPMVYRRLARTLADGFDSYFVQLPARERRLTEAPIPRAEPIVAAVADALASVIDGPYVCYGHSYGALLAYEVARTLSRGPLGEPRHLLLSGFPAPKTGLGPRAASRWNLGDDDLWSEILKLGGVPPEISENSDLRKALIPAFRGDFEAVVHWSVHRAPASTPSLTAPITVLSGREDPEAPPEAMRDWALETAGAFRQLVFDGGHFFNLEDQAGVARVIRDSATGGRGFDDSSVGSP